ncbi:MAG: hypothetical protein M3355_05170 [Actinomycetota bacterium]|nr:hypothetical protein [Actinomycetota bacterium]
MSTLSFVGCGSDEKEVNAAGDAAELARYLPKNAGLVQTVDVVEVRQELDLPEDANATPADDGFLRRRGSPTVRLFQFTTRAFPNVLDALNANLSLEGASPLDGTLIRAAASVDGSPSVIATTESFDDVAAKLKAQGYSLERNLYVAGPKTPAGTSKVVADGANGRIIFARSESEASEILDRIDEEAKPGPAAVAIQRVNGSVRLALTSPDQSSCVEALAAAQSATGDGGILAFTITGEKPDPDRLDTKALSALDTGTPAVLVNALRVPFNVVRPGGDATEPIDEVLRYSVNHSQSQSSEVGGPGRSRPARRPMRLGAYDCP